MLDLGFLTGWLWRIPSSMITACSNTLWLFTPERLCNLVKIWKNVLPSFLLLKSKGRTRQVVNRVVLVCLPPASCWFLVRLTHKPWRRRQYVQLKHWWSPLGLHCITSHTVFILLNVINIFDWNQLLQCKLRLLPA